MTQLRDAVPLSNTDADGGERPRPTTEQGSTPNAVTPREHEPDVQTRDANEETLSRYRPKVLDGAARPSRLAPGRYACRIDAMYRFRPCEVTKDSTGFTRVAMPGSLLGFTGVVYDEGTSLIIDGTSADDRPFGCFGCQLRCTEQPGNCACVELMAGASRECLTQPLRARLTLAGATWRGSMSHANYRNHYEGAGDARHVTRWKVEKTLFLVEIAPESSLPKESSVGRSAR